MRKSRRSCGMCRNDVYIGFFRLKRRKRSGSEPYSKRNCRNLTNSLRQLQVTLLWWKNCLMWTRWPKSFHTSASQSRRSGKYRKGEKSSSESGQDLCQKTGTALGYFFAYVFIRSFLIFLIFFLIITLSFEMIVLPNIFLFLISRSNIFLKDVIAELP